MQRFLYTLLWKNFTLSFLFFLTQIHVWSFSSLLGRNRPGRAGNCCTVTFILCSLLKKKKNQLSIGLTNKLLSIYGDSIKLWLNLCILFERSKCLYCSRLKWNMNQKWLKLGSLHLNGRTCSLNFLQKWRFASGGVFFGHVGGGKGKVSPRNYSCALETVYKRQLYNIVTISLVVSTYCY